MSPRKWTRQRVVDCIQDWHGRGVPTSLIWRQDRCLCAAGFAVFGSWRAALEAAGLTSDRQRWSAERVLAELRAEHQQEKSGNRGRERSSRLDAAATRYFGSRYQALVAAGLRPDRPRRVTRSWTPAQVIEAIQLHASRGLPLSALRTTDPALYACAKRIFGRWRNAIQAAGFDLPCPRTHEDVIQAIRSRHRQGLSLTHVWKTDRDLFSAAKKRFGNWQRALAAAGLPSKTIRRWSKKSIVEAIQRRQRHGPPLSHAWRDDKPLFQAGVNHFGNWRSALQAAGIPVKARQRWSPDRVLEGLRQTYKGQRNYRKDYPELVGAAFRFFGGFYRALEAAGLQPPAGRWTKRRIVEAIQERYVQGQPIQIVGFRDKRLGYAAKRHFGSWYAAVEAAGLESRAPQPAPTRSWTPEAVMAVIRAESLPGSRAAPLWKRDTGLYSAAKKHFGTWRQAVIAAGLEPAQRRWSHELVLQEIAARHQQGLALSSVVSREDCRLSGAAIRYFGSWREAVQAAGLTGTSPQAMRMTNHHQARESACRAKM